MGHAILIFTLKLRDPLPPTTKIKISAHTTPPSSPQAGGVGACHV